MALNIGITTISSNLGVSFEWLVLILILFGGLIFFAKDFRIGTIIMFLGTGLAFMLFYSLGLNYVPAIIFCFISLVIMAFSFYAVGKTTTAGGLI